MVTMSKSVDKVRSNAVETTDTVAGSVRPETYLDPRDADLLYISQAKAAYEQKGLAGAVEVSQSILQDVIDDLSSLAEHNDVKSSDVRFHVSALRELDKILSAAVQEDSQNHSVVGVSLSTDSVDSSDEKEERESPPNTINNVAPKQDHHDSKRVEFVEASIDRVSGSGNILATSPDIPAAHIHVSHGTIGDKVIVLKPARGWKQVKSGKEKAQVLPYNSIEDATKNFSSHQKLHLRVGDRIKVDISDIDGDKGIATLSGFRNVDRVVAFGKPSKQGDQLTVEVQEIDEDTARAYVVKRNRKSKKRKKTKKSKKSKKRKKRRTKKKYKNRPSRRSWHRGQGLKKSPIPQGNNTNKNELLNGKL